MKRFTMFLLSMLIVVYFTGCKGAIDAMNDTVGGLLSGDSGVTLNSKVYGSVSGTTQSSSSSAFSISKSSSVLYASDPATSCDYSDFSVYMVGGDGTAISTGNAIGGNFRADVNSEHEVIIEFDCGMVCFGKPNSTDLICDPISTAVVGALDDSLTDVSLKSSPLLEGLSLATIASGLSEILKLMSQLDPTNNIVEKLETAAAASDRVKMQEIIMQSSVGEMFTSMATLAVEKKLENEALAAGLTRKQAKDAAAQAQWKIENVVKMVSGIGLVINFALDDAGGEGLDLYSGIMDNIGAWSGSDFVSEFRWYLGAPLGAHGYQYGGLFNRIYDLKQTMGITLVCRARRDSSNSPSQEVFYPPSVDNSDNGYAELTCINADSDLLGVTSGGDTTGDFRIDAQIRPSSKEPNRNDPTGIHESEQGRMEEFSVTILNVFQEFMDAMMPGGVCSADVSGDIDGGEFEFLQHFNECVIEHGLGSYFSGLIGIYIAMRDSSLRSTMFSLEDLHTAMVGFDYMGIGMSANFWQIGLDDQGIDLDISGDSHSTNIRAYQLLDTTVDSGDGNIYSEIHIVCPEEFNGSCNTSDPTTDISTSEALIALYERYMPTYYTTMKMFEDIPTMAEIKSSIFKDSHHEPYNIAGPKTFHVLGNVTGGGTGEATAPVLCKIVNSNSAGDFVVGTSSITCEIATAGDVSWDSEGNPTSLTTYYSQYGSFYALVERGNNNSAGGDSDRFYGLLNINNGTEYFLNGRQFRVRGIRSGYSDDSTVSLVKNGSQLYDLNKEFCNTWEDSEGTMQQNCWQEKFDYVAVEFSDATDDGLFRTSEYGAFTWQIPMTWRWWDRASGEIIEEEGYLGVAVSHNNSEDNREDDWAVCLRGSDVSVDTNNGGRVIAPISIGIGRLVDCFNVPAEETNYYFLAPQWGADTSSDQMYRLMKDDQTWMWSDASPDNSLVSLPSLVAAEADEAFSIGPETANRYMNYFKIANLGHDAKFDPYCDDANGNGECDCKDLDGDKSCTLADEFTENTISEPPIWPGDNNASVIMDMLQTCGNKTGGSLAYCLKGIGLPSNTYFNQSIFECAENASRKIQWIDVTGMLAYGGGDADYGQGCSDVSADNYMGSLRLKNLIKRNNAYSIERPNKLMKLISTATATVGTGNPLASTAEVFNFQEALALVFLRLNLPVYSSVKDASHDSPYTNLDNDRVDGLSIYFKNVRLPGKQSDIASGLLRKFLEKAGTID